MADVRQQVCTAVRDDLGHHRDFLLPLAIQRLPLSAATALNNIMQSAAVTTSKNCSDIAVSTRSASKFTRNMFENIPCSMEKWVRDDDFMGLAVELVESKKARHFLSGVFGSLEAVRVVLRASQHVLHGLVHVPLS